jgi:tripartite ATP-independent transporter DctM subunit
MAGAAPTAKPAPFLKPLDLLDRGVLLAESSLSVVIVAVMIAMGVIGAAGALLSIQNDVTRAVDDVLMNGAIWAAFLGASFATRGRKHLAIDALGRLLPDRVRRVMVAVASTLGSVVAAALAYGVYEALIEQGHAVDEQVQGMISSGIEGARVDRGYQFQFMIAAGFGLIAVRLLLHGFHELMAAIAGNVSPAAPPPPAPASGELKIPHEEPDGSPSSPGDESRVAPFEQAGGVEVIIASVALLVPIPLAIGTIAFIPVVVASLAAIASLLVPLYLRHRKTKSIEATSPVPHDYAVVKSPIEPIGALAGVAAVLGVAYFGVQHIGDVSIGAGIAFFAIMALMGAPLFTFLGGLALFLWVHGSDVVPSTPLASAVEDVLGNHFARMSVLPTIPIFTLAGYLMSESNTPKRLVRVARALLGWMPGGLAVVCVLASAAFTVFSGASGITIVAIGGLLFPALIKDGYPEKFSLGLVTSGGALGITIVPCLPLIVYGIVAGLQETPPGVEHVELQKMIVAGILPGLLVVALMAAYAIVVGVTKKIPRSSFDGAEAAAALWEAKWELALPLVVGFGLVVTGPLGAASLTAAYVFIVEVFLYRDLSLFRDVPRIVPDSMVLVGAIFVKLCAATVLTFYFVQAQTADVLFEALTCGPPAQAYLAEHSDVMVNCREAVDALAQRNESAGGLIDSQITFLLALNVFLLIVGMLMDIFSAIVVIVPLIMGIAIHFDIDPYHLGIVFLINLEIGYLMPPMGLNLFIAGFRFGRPVPDLYRVVLPFIGVFATSLFIITYVPWLTTGLIPGYTPLSAHADEGGGETGGEPTPDTSGGGEAGGGEAGGADCDVPREGETFEDFEARCSSAGGGGGGGGGADTADCDVPRENESFDEFEARCSGGGGGGAAAAPDTADCEVPRETESFEDFEARCNPSAAGGAAPEGAAADPGAAAAEGGAAPTGGEGSTPEGSARPDCDLPRPDESFEAFQARCGL